LASDQRYLLLWVVAVLLVPNIVLDITESYAPAWKAANVLLPAGFYLMWMCASKRTGMMTLLAFPFMILAAFQIVLIHLYGESIIAVDMFLNVVTTNVDEVNELLSNLLEAIFTVALLYLPPLAVAAVALYRKRTVNAPFRRKTGIAGCALIVAGAIASVGASVYAGKGQFHRDVFPVNVCCNMAEAVKRTHQTLHYAETSKGFTYQAASTHAADEREIYLFVIGETSRAENWQLGGYERETNPRLSKEDNLVFFRRSISESNTTHKSVPMLISPLTSETFDSIQCYKSIITAMKEAGFHTCFFSNQAPNRSYTQYFGDEADEVRYTDFTKKQHPMDSELIDMLRQAVADTTHTKLFVVMHTYGSHFLYRDRYPREFARFLPDNAIDAVPAHRSDLINAYDNTIRYTDNVLADAIGVLRSAECRSAMVYSSDHGEDIFDDSRKRFLHASPTPTYHQLHVATLAWMSDEAAAAMPNQMEALKRNSSLPVSPQKALYNTIIDISGVTTPYFKKARSLAGSAYKPQHAVYLTDLNIAVPIEDSGIKAIDEAAFDKLLTTKQVTPNRKTQQSAQK